MEKVLSLRTKFFGNFCNVGSFSKPKPIFGKFLKSIVKTYPEYAIGKFSILLHSLFLSLRFRVCYSTEERCNDNLRNFVYFGISFVSSSVFPVFQLWRGFTPKIERGKKFTDSSHG